MNSRDHLDKDEQSETGCQAARSIWKAQQPGSEDQVQEPKGLSQVEILIETKDKVKDCQQL